MIRDKNNNNKTKHHPPTPSPCSFQVRVYDLSKYEHEADDVLILATDGLWDVLSNEEVAEAVTQFLPNCDPDDPHRWVSLYALYNQSHRGSCFTVGAVGIAQEPNTEGTTYLIRGSPVTT